MTFRPLRKLEDFFDLTSPSEEKSWYWFWFITLIYNFSIKYHIHFCYPDRFWFEQAFFIEITWSVIIWTGLKSSSFSGLQILLLGSQSTLGSRIEVPVCLFFFGFFPQPVCLIWVYVFNSFFKKWIACWLIWDMCAYLRHVCLLATIFLEFCQMYSTAVSRLAFLG